MISIVITTFKEPKTIGKSIASFTNQQIKTDYELYVLAPDEETLKIARRYQKKDKHIKLFRDPGKGKSYALNLVLPKLKGEIIILSDGDVYVSDNSVSEILKYFNEKDVGCVTGRPIPLENKKDKYGFWANFLFDSAHKLRKNLDKQNKLFECSGYLWAFKNKIIENFPLDIAEDTIVPHLFLEKGYKTKYSDEALVYVKNVNNWKDWKNQKIRTIKSHEKFKEYTDYPRSVLKTKSFLNESKGILYIFSYPNSLKELFWLIQLILARFYIWVIFFMGFFISKKHYRDGWKRVESTK